MKLSWSIGSQFDVIIRVRYGPAHCRLDGLAGLGEIISYHRDIPQVDLADRSDLGIRAGNRKDGKNEPGIAVGIAVLQRNSFAIEYEVLAVESRQNLV